jgi:hypothetical protein
MAWALGQLQVELEAKSKENEEVKQMCGDLMAAQEASALA